MTRHYNAEYRNDHLNHVAFPMGGIGAGMICLEGTGAFSHVSLRHKPDVFNEPRIFAALYIKGVRTARVLEGPVPMRKVFGLPGAGSGGGGSGTYGLPRFADVSFTTRFPFGKVRLSDKTMPVTVELTGWSPFIPGDADSASLPVAGLEYCIQNRTAKPVKGVFSFHAANFMKSGNDSGDSIQPMAGGFTLDQPPVPDKPWEEGHFAALTTDKAARADCAWFRGRKFDQLTMLWKSVATGQIHSRPPHSDGMTGGGGSIYVPFTLKARQVKTIQVLLAWYVPLTNMRVGKDPAPASGCEGSSSCGCSGNKPVTLATYTPWYAGRFKSLAEVAAYWRNHYERLRAMSAVFSDCFYNTTLPPEAVEAVAANLTILKSPTCLRDTEGRFWGWEGCGDGGGCCSGSCTHVWNYAQAMPHLFPDLERTLRETEFGVSQDSRGHQNFRASLPIREPDHAFHAAADGQLGGLMKLYREWRISGDTAWMKRLWPKARQSLDYCMATWDPDHTGTLIEPHHNTYDIEFWGADCMCTGFYLGALQAVITMGKACGETVQAYEELLARGKKAMETSLWNGEYFIQKVQWTGLRAPSPGYTPEAMEIMNTEGPKYQYGNGCLSDGMLGDWLARVCGLPSVLDAKKIKKHLMAVFQHNFKTSLADHANPQRPRYAFGREGGLLLCSWPQGDKLSLPFVYSDEVWTGIEYQAASHLIMMGRVQEGLQIVREVRTRYDGRYRNPFNEYECGHWYARAMSSYGLLQAFSGARYDAVEKVLTLTPAVKGDFRAFFSTATGFGAVGIRKGKPFLKIHMGALDVKRIKLSMA